MALEIVDERFSEVATLQTLLRTPAEIRIAGTRSESAKTTFHGASMIAGLEFLAWMESRRRPVTPKDVMDRFGCSKATSYRWFRTYADARHLVWPPEDHQPVSFPARPSVPAYAGGALQ
jgi:hypothetical protein